jgi:uncharacterized protein DUF4396
MTTRTPTVPVSNSDALSATLHGLTGCAIGEIVGMVVATALGLSNGASIVLAIFSRSRSATR